jgi:hypothetical protein
VKHLTPEPTPSFEDWLGDYDPNDIYEWVTDFMRVSDPDLYQKWGDRLQRNYREAYGLAEPDLVQNYLDEISDEISNVLRTGNRRQVTVAGIELFTKIKGIWQDELKKDKDDPHYAELYRLTTTICTELMGLQLDEKGVPL